MSFEPIKNELAESTAKSNIAIYTASAISVCTVLYVVDVREGGPIFWSVALALLLPHTHTCASNMKG